MKKQEFLSVLKNNLDGLSNEDIQDIIRDQEEYINDSMSAGRAEETAVESLGDPREFAANLRAQARISRAEKTTTLPQKMKSTTSAVFAVLALAPLNIIFILGPFLFLSMMIFVGWAVAMSLFGGALGTLGMFLFNLVFIHVGIWTHLSAFFLSAGLVGTSVLGLMLMYKISELMIKFSIQYLKWNVNFVKQQQV